jgi:hypothetical protein
VGAQFHLNDEMRRQGHAEKEALDTFNSSLKGLSCRVDSDLILRAARAEWTHWRRVRTLWVSVSGDPDAARMAIGLMPEDLPALHRPFHRNTQATFSSGWARQPLVEAALRCVIAVLTDDELPPDRPFAVRARAVPHWAIALAVHYLGIRELRPAAVESYQQRGVVNAEMAGIRCGDLSQSITKLLKNIDYLYSGNATETLLRIPKISGKLFHALVIAIACGALEGRSAASEAQIQRLKRQLPSAFRVEMVSTLPELASDGRIIPTPTDSSENVVSFRKSAEARSSRGAERSLGRSL